MVVNADPHPSDTFGSNAKRRNRLSRATLDAEKVKELNRKDAMIADKKLQSRNTGRDGNAYCRPFVDMFTEGSPGTGLLGGVRSCRKGAKVAFPWTDIVVEGEQVGTGFQLDQSCFEIVPRTSEHGSCRWGSLASG